MKIHVSRDIKPTKVGHLFILVPETGAAPQFDLAPEAEALVRAAVADAGASGRSEETVTLVGRKPKKITLIGVGKPAKLTQRGMRGAFGTIAKIVRKQRDKSIAVVTSFRVAGVTDEKSVRWILDALSNADYRYDAWMTPVEDDERITVDCTLIVPKALDARTTKRALSSAEIIADAVRTVRDLGNGPGNDVTPERLAARAQEVARAVGVKCTVYDKRQIERMKMGGLLAVNQGSDKEPRFIVLEYTPKRAGKTVALVGKGITFDSGGISIKPSEKMEEMKFDMCGAAAVIGTIEAAARLGIPHRIIACIPATENLPSGSAYKPGDIVRTMSGKTVEVVNTDAEGRVILADALYFACQKKPDYLIDFATLTGACVIALAHEATGLFSNDDELARKLIESGERAGERLWRLPEWDEYKEYIRSDWADMKNSGGRWGGASTAAVFLKEFVSCRSWAHLDIAGTANSDRDPKGATGVGVRLMIDFLESLD